MDENLQPCKIVLDMKVMYERQSTVSASETSHTGEPNQDGFSEAGISKNGSIPNHREAVRRRSSWMSAALAPGGLSFFIATCTVFGVNAFSVYLPWAFAQGGILFTSIILVAVVLQTNIATAFLLEASARAQALDLLMPDGSLPRHYTLKIRERKYELSLLTNIFLGRKWFLFFSLTTLACMYGIMWALCTTFANAFADKFPLGDAQDGGYIPYVVMFMAVTVPLSCTSLADQQWIQMSFVMIRLVMVILMVGTVVIAYGSDEGHFGSQVGPVNDISLAKPSNIVQVTMTCIFGSIVQFAVPTIADETRSKTGLSRVFGIATTLTCISNLLLGILLAMFFGQDQPDTANLNWVNYHGGTGEGDPAAWATAISSYTVLAAAIHCFPQSALVAMSTGGIVMGAVYGDRAHEVEKNWRIRTAFRLLASVPPAFGAMVLSDFSVIAKYTGIFTILSYTVCPALLALSSRVCTKKENCSCN
jgi:hypothetical protein